MTFGGGNVTFLLQDLLVAIEAFAITWLSGHDFFFQAEDGIRDRDG